jgi:hypothetical protein
MHFARDSTCRIMPIVMTSALGSGSVKRPMRSRAIAQASGSDGFPATGRRRQIKAHALQGGCRHFDAEQLVAPPTSQSVLY